ncbi:hypothetical protein A3715_18400 [Oleiphilus sp. HI0009]|nr:hypothetical protein A3715_18400 [Oleiphilus sp. HI0009]
MLRWFSKNKNELDFDEVYLKEVPRYPPFKQGIPSFGHKECLAQHKDIVEPLSSSLRMKTEEFEKFVQPILINYARFVHLCPASKNHHHRAAGGLLRHGLEVGYYCAMSASGVIFSSKKTPNYRTAVEDKYIFAAFLTGLMHDIGKVISDMDIVDIDDERVHWNPYSGYLTDWILSKEGRRYLVKWKPTRTHKNHEIFAVYCLEKVLNKDALDYLTDYGRYPEVMESVVLVCGNSKKVMAGTDAEILLDILKLSEKKSIVRDMKGEESIIGSDKSPVPMCDMIASQIMHCIDNQALFINQKNSQVIRKDDQLFLLVNDATFSKIYEGLKADGTDIPFDIDAFKQIMIDHGIILTKDEEPIKENVLVKMGNGIQFEHLMYAADPNKFDPLMAMELDESKITIGKKEEKVSRIKRDEKKNKGDKKKEDSIEKKTKVEQKETVSETSKDQDKKKVEENKKQQSEINFDDLISSFSDQNKKDLNGKVKQKTKAINENETKGKAKGIENRDKKEVDHKKEDVVASEFKPIKFRILENIQKHTERGVIPLLESSNEQMVIEAIPRVLYGMLSKELNISTSLIKKEIENIAQIETQIKRENIFRFNLGILEEA